MRGAYVTRAYVSRRRGGEGRETRAKLLGRYLFSHFFLSLPVESAAKGGSAGGRERGEEGKRLSGSEVFDLIYTE